MSSKTLFVAFDIETTGLIAGVDRIAELAAVAFRGETVLEELARLVDPGISMPPAAGQVNGITDDMLRGAPPVREVLPDFLSFLSQGTPVAHNAQFDVAFLRADIESLGLSPPGGPVLDTRGLARRAFPGRFSYSLERLARDLGLETRGAHRALADAQACRRLFQSCVEVLGKGEELPVEELARLSGRPLDFSSHAPRDAETARLLQLALAQGGAMDISYRSARGEVTARRIRPLSFTIIGGSPAVVAFCMLRGDERTFLLDSIETARPAE